MHAKYFCQAFYFKTPSFQFLPLFMRRCTAQAAIPAMAQLNTAVTAMRAMEDCFGSLAGEAEEEQKAVWRHEGETAGLALDLNVRVGRGVPGRALGRRRGLQSCFGRIFVGRGSGGLDY